MNYKQKRTQAKISFYTMCKRLGIDEKKYREVEKGERLLQGEYIDKFYETIAKAKEINLERSIKIKKINEWRESGQAAKDMKAMGYTDYSLAQVSGISQATINRVRNNVIDYPISDDLKEKVYDFLQNPMNKNIEKLDITKKKKEKPIVEELNVDIDKNVKEDENEIKNTPIKLENNKDVETLRLENDRLKRQIMLYEKLIERL